MNNSLFLLLILIVHYEGNEGCNKNKTNPTPSETIRKDTIEKATFHTPKQAIVLTADDFEDMEVYYPVFRLREEGWKVIIAAPDMDTITGEHGYELAPDMTIDEVNPDDYDLLILPGGSPDGAPSTVRELVEAQNIAKSFFNKNKAVATICHGPYTLISAGLVKGRHLTSYWHDGVPEEIKAAGGIWEDKEVVVDSNLISSRWPMDLPAFMREVMRRVNSE